MTMKEFRVLLTDDDPIILALYRAALREIPTLKLDTCSSHAECSGLIRQNEYDCAIFDIELGDGGTGIDLLRQIRIRSGQTFVLMISGKDDTETVTMCRNAGANRFASKQLNALRMVRECLHDLVAGNARGDFASLCSA